jgi:hypothetical protein
VVYFPRRLTPPPELDQQAARIYVTVGATVNICCIKEQGIAFVHETSRLVGERPNNGSLHGAEDYDALVKQILECRVVIVYLDYLCRQDASMTMVMEIAQRANVKVVVIYSPHGVHGLPFYLLEIPWCTYVPFDPSNKGWAKLLAYTLTQTLKRLLWVAVTLLVAPDG